jgi:hypothetical protein
MLPAFYRIPSHSIKCLAFLGIVYNEIDSNTYIRPCLDCLSKGTLQSHSGSMNRMYIFYSLVFVFCSSVGLSSPLPKFEELSLDSEYCTMCESVVPTNNSGDLRSHYEEVHPGCNKPAPPPASGIRCGSVHVARESFSAFNHFTSLYKFIKA